MNKGLPQFFALFILAASMSACHTIPIPPFTDAPSPSDGSATVYLYRDSTPYMAAGVTILVDGKELLYLFNKKWTYFYLPVGDHKFEAKWPRSTGIGAGAQGTLKIENNEPHFLRLQPIDSKSGGVVPIATQAGMTFMPVIHFSFGFAETNRTAALPILNKCRYVAVSTKSEKER